MRLVFLGTPEFALPSLRILHEKSHDIALVLSQPDRPRGRGQRLTPAPVRAMALELGLPNATLEKGERAAVYEKIIDLEPEAIVVVAFGHILREPLLNGAPHGCINVHASLLPRWRGPAPIHRALVAGDRETGVSIMRLDPGVDTGPVYLRRSTEIPEHERGPELHDRLALLGAEALADVLVAIEREGLEPKAQSSEGVTHAPLLRREEGSVRFDRPVKAVHDRVRGLQPWPAVTVLLGDRRLKLLRGRPLPGEPPAAAPGELVGMGAGGIDVRCLDGVYRIEELQPQAKRVMSAADFARGAGLASGAVLTPLPDFHEPDA